MTWIKLDDTFPDSPKIVRISDAAFRVHVTCICYCSRMLTDGLVPWDFAMNVGRSTDYGKLSFTGQHEPEYSGPDGLVNELVNAGLWEEIEDEGFVIHDYLAHQRSKAEIVSERERLRANTANHRSRKRAEISTGNRPVTDYSPACNRDVTRTDTDADTDAEEDSSARAHLASRQASSSSPRVRAKPDAGWPACWCRSDPENEIPGAIREALEAEWARAGGNGTGSDETAKAILAAVRIDAAAVVDGLKSLALRAEPVRKPGAWLLDRAKKRQRDLDVAERIRSEKTARRAPVDPEAARKNQPALHATLWDSGGRPATWRSCGCAACSAGRTAAVDSEAPSNPKGAAES